MAVDSAAAFTDRYCDNTMQLGAHAKRFADAGWHTYADLVFSTTFTPQNGDEESYVRDIVMKGLGDVNHGDRTKLRRLFFEAYTMVGADLRRTVESPSGNAPREIPNAELEARRDRTEARVKGIKLLNELDISDRLLIRAIEIYDSNRMGYIGPDLCTKRGNTMVGIQKDQQWESSPNANGGFTLRRAEDGRRVDVDGQFAFSYAFQRRSLALDMAEILDFDNSETLRLQYIAKVMASSPAGFLAIGFEQILDADRYFWIKMGEVTRKGIKMKPDGRPCDKVFDEVFKDFTFNMMLMPRQGVARAAPAAPTRPVHTPLPHTPTSATPPALGKKQLRRQQAAERGGGGKSSGKEQAAADAIANAFKKPRTDGRPGGGRDTLDSGARATGSRLPAKLIGMCSVSSKETGSKKFCFSYNIDGCAAAAPGSACPKGLHACMKPLHDKEACSGPHATFACNR